MRRIDPAEPWRYVCPDCGSVQLYSLLKPMDKAPSSDGEGEYACRSCDERKPQVVDRKEERLAQP